MSQKLFTDTKKYRGNNMKFVLMISLLFLMSCSSLREYAEYQKTLPKYGLVYLPFSGELDNNHRRQFSYICSLEATAHYNSKYEEAGKVKSPSNYECSSRISHGLGTINTSCKEKSSLLSSATGERMILSTQRTQIIDSYMKTCMAKSGYIKKRVCIKNCNNTR